VPADEVEAAWRLEDGELLLERRHPDGCLFLRIDACEPFGYRIWAPYYGRHLVSADGTPSPPRFRAFRSCAGSGCSSRRCFRWLGAPGALRSFARARSRCAVAPWP
jgi:hypothetical protein